MLKIAIPNKGSLSEGAITLFSEAGYRPKRYGKELIVLDEAQDIEFVFLRPRDIAVYVGNGTIDMGITGADLAADSRAPVRSLLDLGFGKSRFFYAVPKDRSAAVEQLAGLRIATSYPAIVEKDMRARNLGVTIVKLDGAVEISIRLGVADAIADVVESGQTLREAGLKTIGEPVMRSEAILAVKKDIEITAAMQTVRERLEGILLARTYAVIEYDVPEGALKKCCELTPGIESPTISALQEKGWFAVKAMVKNKEANAIMDALKAEGAKGIMLNRISSCRL